MSMFRRRLLMMAASAPSPGGGLPAGWSEVVYVLTKIGQKEYFDTGVIPTRNTKVEMKVRFKDYPTFGVFSCFGVSGENNNFLLRTHGNKLRAEYGTNVLDLGFAINNSTQYVVVKDGKDNYIDGVKYASNPTITLTTTRTLWLCGINGNTPYITGEYVYYCKIWENGEPVRDFIPVSDGTREALYDKVTKTLFYKQTGPKTLDTDNEAEGGVE